MIFEIKTRYAFYGQNIHLMWTKKSIFTTKINFIIHYLFVLFPIKCHPPKKKNCKQRHQSNLMALSSFCCRVEIIISSLIQFKIDVDNRVTHSLFQNHKIIYFHFKREGIQRDCFIELLIHSC